MNLYCIRIVNRAFQKQIYVEEVSATEALYIAAQFAGVVVINEAVKQDGHGIAYIEANLGNGNRVWVYEARHNHPEWLKETASA